MESSSSLITKKRKTTEKKEKVQKVKKEKVQKVKKKHSIDDENEEPKPKPKRGRKKKVVDPIQVTTEKVDEIFITDEQPVYCRAPIEFGGMTIFTKIEHPPSPPPLPKTKPMSETQQQQNKKNKTVKLKNEHNWKTKVEKNNLKVLTTKFGKENVSCWHCVHEFEGNAVSLPVSYSIKRGYLCHGVFCGWGCVKTWNMESMSQMKFQRNDFINKLIRLSNNGAYARIQPAPNRYILKKFGGSMEIDEFREKSLFTSENIFFHEDGSIPNNEIKINFTQKTPCSEIEF